MRRRTPKHIAAARRLATLHAVSLARADQQAAAARDNTLPPAAAYAMPSVDRDAIDAEIDRVQAMYARRDHEFRMDDRRTLRRQQRVMLESCGLVAKFKYIHTAHGTARLHDLGTHLFDRRTGAFVAVLMRSDLIAFAKGYRAAKKGGDA